MTERELRAPIEAVRDGTASRREFIGTLIGLGHTGWDSDFRAPHDRHRDA